MKTFGWVLTILGTLSMIGNLIGGNSPAGQIFLIGVGIFLLYKGYGKE